MAVGSCIVPVICPPLVFLEQVGKSYWTWRDAAILATNVPWPVLYVLSRCRRLQP